MSFLRRLLRYGLLCVTSFTVVILLQSTDISKYKHDDIIKITNHQIQHITNITNNITFNHWEWFRTYKPPPSSVYAEFLISPVDLCKTSTGIINLDYLLVVHTALDHADHRQIIRETFGGRNLYNKTSRTVFVVGTTSNVTLTRELHKESRNYGDFVQGNFVDSYHNLTHKGVVWLRWVSQYCGNVTYVIKVDDDVIVNLPRVINHVMPGFGSIRNRTVLCPLTSSGTIFRNGSTQKWIVDNYEFPGLAVYPFSFCHGFFVIVTGDLIKPMLDAAKVVPFFWIDDVYLFGMLLASIEGIQFERMWRGDAPFMSSLPCFQQYGKDCMYNVVNNRGSSSFDRLAALNLWNLINTNTPLPRTRVVHRRHRHFLH